jgi:uncharacterized protein (DUF58 family)
VDIEKVFARFRALKQAIRPARRASSVWFGEHRSAFRGSGFDLAGIEPWRPGQPLRDIAWRRSLRTWPTRIYKIERIEQKQIPTLLVVDLSHSTLFELSRDSNKALLLLDVIGTIGLSRAGLHDPVGLLAFSDRIELFVKPMAGTAQIFRIAHELFARLELARESPLRRRADLAVALRFVAARMKTRHSLLIISDLVGLTGDEDVLDFELVGRLASKHDVSMLVLDDPDEFKSSTRLGFLRIADIETGEQTVVATRRLPLIRHDIEEALTRVRARLRRECGVASVVLTPGDYFLALARFFAPRSSR